MNMKVKSERPMKQFKGAILQSISRLDFLSSIKGRAEWYMMVIGMSILVLFLGIAVFAPYISPHDPNAMVDKPFLPPNSKHIMGTNQLGQDVFSRFVWGSRTSLLIAGLSTIIAFVIGVPLGLLSGFVGGKLDRVLSMIMDAIYAFPGLILAIAVATMLGPGILNVAVSLAVVYAPTYFRVIRSQTLSVREQLYVEAAKALGADKMTIMSYYIFPNVIPSVVVISSLCIADAILTAAGLSFIGVGISPEIPDWGYDVSNGQRFLTYRAWWIITFPGLGILFTVIGFSLLGESLDEILNPKLREK